MRRADEKEMRVMFDYLEDLVSYGLMAKVEYPHEFARQAGRMEATLETIGDNLKYWRKILDINDLNNNENE